MRMLQVDRSLQMDAGEAFAQAKLVELEHVFTVPVYYTVAHYKPYIQPGWVSRL